MLKADKICVTVVTPTWQRRSGLINCIEQVRNQDFKKPYEHIVISDGPDEEVEVICSYYGIKCKCIKRDLNAGTSKGHLARDTGIDMAQGDFIVCWDDDNVYFNHALSTLYSASKDCDIGVCDIHFQMRPPDSLLAFARQKDTNNIYCTLPKNWSGSFEIRNIDTMNVMVRKSTATGVKWSASKEYEGDFYWLRSLAAMGASTNYFSKHIGIKLL